MKQLVNEELCRRGKNVAKKPKPEPDNKEQSSRFVETAKALGVDESGKDFDRAMKSVIPPKPTPKKKSGPS